MIVFLNATQNPIDHFYQIKMKEERYLKDREAIVRADIWKEITSSCKGLRTELGYTNVQIVDFLKEITKTFERDQLWILQVEIYFLN